MNEKKDVKKNNKWEIYKIGKKYKLPFNSSPPIWKGYIKKIKKFEEIKRACQQKKIVVIIMVKRKLLVNEMVSSSSLSSATLMCRMEDRLDEEVNKMGEKLENVLLKLKIMDLGSERASESIEYLAKEIGDMEQDLIKKINKVGREEISGKKRM